MKNLITLTLLALITLSLNSCGQIDSDQVDQQEIYTSYNAIYNEDSSELSVSASFTVGGSMGTYVWLNDKSSISLSGNTMRGKDNLFNQVEYQYKGRHTLSTSKSKVIQYKNEEGELYNNSVNLPGRISFTGGGASRELGLDLSWNAEEGFYGQTLSVYLTSDGHNKEVVYHYMDSANGTIHIDAERLAPLATNEFEIQICRRRSNSNIQSPQVGGYLVSTYCSKKTTFQLQN